MAKTISSTNHDVELVLGLIRSGALDADFPKIEGLISWRKKVMAAGLKAGDWVRTSATVSPKAFANHVFRVHAVKRGSKRVEVIEPEGYGKAYQIGDETDLSTLREIASGVQTISLGKVYMPMSIPADALTKIDAPKGV